MNAISKVYGFFSVSVNREQKYSLIVSNILLLCSILYSGILDARGFQQITFITSKSGGTYQEFINAFKDAYANAGQADKELQFGTLSLSESSIPYNFRNSGKTLLITVGSKAAEQTAAVNPGIPVIYAMLPFSTYQRIAAEDEACPTSTAIYLDQPVRRQLNLSREIFPQRKEYGIFLGKNSEQRYLKEKKNHRLDGETIKTSLIHESKQLAWSLRKLSENTDVFIAINDPLVFNPNNAKWLLYMAYQEGIPVIGFSSPYVAAGAAAAVYSTPVQLGKQTAENLIKQQSQNNECLFHPQYPAYFKVATNKAVIGSLSGRNSSEGEILNRLVEQEGDR